MISGEINDTRVLLDEQNEKNELLERKFRKVDAELMEVIRSLGGSTRRYARERRRSLRAVIRERYSPPRVGAAAPLRPNRTRQTKLHDMSEVPKLIRNASHAQK